MNRYCVGPTMAVDWGDEGPPPAVRRAMMRRVLSYFGPYRRPGLIVVACIAAQAVLGLAPAVVFKTLIDTLAHPHPTFGRVGGRQNQPTPEAIEAVQVRRPATQTATSGADE